MNPRTKRKLEKINNRLTEFSQTTRILHLTSNSVTLNTEVTLIGNDANKFVKRVMNTKVDDWVKNIDKLLFGEVLESTIKAISCAVGGKACQKLHGSKIKKNLNNGIPWNAGTKGARIGTLLPKTELTKKKISEKNFGSGNGMFGYKYSDEEKVARSESMREKIRNGEFTPKLNNQAELDGTTYRSSWEALYKYINPNANYEELRISYQHADASKIYIVDFIDHIDKQVIEVKPKELCFGEKFACKMNALTEWANANEYTVLIVDKDWLLTHPPILEYSRFDKNTVKKIKALYEAHKKN
jgi:uncharacterized FlaG/YvyC family protein